MKTEIERAARVRAVTSRQPTDGRRETRFCRHCDSDVVAIATSRGWAWAIPVVAVSIASALFAAMMIGPFALLALAPIVMLALAVGPFVAELRRPPICSECRRETPYASRDEARMAAAPDLHARGSRLVQPGQPGLNEPSAPAI